MQHTEEQKKPFDALWRAYNLPIGGSEYCSLLDRWLGIRAGVYKTTEGLLSDRTALDCARLLLQLRCCVGGVFSMAVGRNEWVEYQNTALVEAMESGLQERLASMVGKADGALILGKGFGGGDTGRAFLIDCPDCNPQEATFSDAELTAIVRYEESTLKVVGKLQGRKVRKRDNSKDYDGVGKSAELGLEATIILETIKGLHFSPKGEDSDKVIFRYNFVFEYMETAGLLDYRPDKQALLANGMKMRERYIKNWISAYRDTKITLHQERE